MAGRASSKSLANEHSTLESQLLRVAKGDHEAFNSVFEQLASPILGVARQVLRDPAQAEEVTQEVLVEIWRDAGRFDGAHGRARAWALSMAHARAVDRVRAHGPAARRATSAANPPGTSVLDEHDDTGDAPSDRKLVRDGLDDLTDSQRQSVTLAYYGGYSCSQVAHLLNISSDAVKSGLRDGMARLRDRLAATA